MWQPAFLIVLPSSLIGSDCENLQPDLDPDIHMEMAVETRRDPILSTETFTAEIHTCLLEHFSNDFFQGAHDSDPQDFFRKQPDSNIKKLNAVEVKVHSLTEQQLHRH
ncbi:unnamed protein product [Arctogadus glacialis]